MAEFVMLIGLPASGKSTYAQSLNKTHVVCSSDEIRAELGDVNDQKKNGQVFSIMEERALTALKCGKNVVYDATNLKRKDRAKILSVIPDGVICRAIVFAVPYEECLERNAVRDRIVPGKVMKRMYMSFEIPWYNEGFRSIEIFGEQRFSLVDYLEQHKEVPHDNPHHKESIYQHMQYASIAAQQCNNELVKEAARYHDIGKFETKQFKNGIAHYYGHQNVGAYMVLCSDLNLTQYSKLVVANLIQHHMDYYVYKDELEMRKAIGGIGMNIMLDMVHQYDLEAHIVD